MGAAAFALLFSAAMGTGSAAKGGNGGGPGNDGGCGQGQGASQGCEPDRGGECGNGQHSGNPHCDGDPTSTPTVEPTVVVTPTATVEPTVTPTPEVVVVDQPEEDTPVTVVHTVPVVSTVVDIVTPPAVFGGNPAPQPVFTFGNYPQPVFTPEAFDITTITSLPKAGDGSASADNDAMNLVLIVGAVLAVFFAAKMVSRRR